MGDIPIFTPSNSVDVNPTNMTRIGPKEVKVILSDQLNLRIILPLKRHIYTYTRGRRGRSLIDTGKFETMKGFYARFQGKHYRVIEHNSSYIMYIHCTELEFR